MTKPHALTLSHSQRRKRKCTKAVQRTEYGHRRRELSNEDLAVPMQHSDASKKIITDTCIKCQDPGRWRHWLCLDIAADAQWWITRDEQGGADTDTMRPFSGTPGCRNRLSLMVMKAQTRQNNVISSSRNKEPPLCDVWWPVWLLVAPISFQCELPTCAYFQQKYWKKPVVKAGVGQMVVGVLTLFFFK